MIDPSVFLLLLVLGALAAAPMLLRRHRGTTPDGVRVVGRTALHKNAVVAVVAVGDRRLLVGAGERGVHLIAELDRAVTEDEIDPRAAAALVRTTTMTSTDLYDLNLVGRMDAVDPTHLSTSPGDALDALAGLDLGSDVTTAGPRIGLVDRLRGMTVRTPVPGRPLRVPLRR